MTENKFTEFVKIVERLRKECPWDREQTHDSIKDATLEETYEVLEAIDNKDYDELKKELGDMLLHVVFHSKIAEENDNFKLDEVIDFVQEKLIRRHPHIFGEKEAKDSEAVKKNWETIKLSEGRESVLEGVPKELPSLQRAYRLQDKASKVGFDWQNKQDVWKKVIEEIEEMHECERIGDKEELEKEIGDVFFSLVNYSRFLGINPENALRRTNEKFIFRFDYVQRKIKESGKNITDSTLEEMDKYWDESKTKE
ncbi:MAG: nucleoside triphosphate pyrophosphohydrolase [Bacteroidota bacterium]|nr:nucleoside triphosphate pyrophosphohydrolase [Bacteroidota bacterium]MDP4192946.1 nucleoside triphosphate pyrophosphohydrolase [Bacteroidota bacterium]MDP4196754.1 nucleoside triphosphate pyrophosphohydrolase [Bacteroidota bacterium]